MDVSKTVNEISLSSNLTDLLATVLAKDLLMQMVFISVIGVLTFGILDVILNNDVEIMKAPKLDKESKRIASSAIMFLLIVILPIIYIIQQIYYVPGIPFKAIFACIVISVGGGFIMGLFFKRTLPKDHIARTKAFPIAEAISELFSTTLDFSIGLSHTFITGILSVIIKVLNGPLIYRYATVAVVLNIVISGGLVMFMGSTQGSGFANLAGSAVGGGLHYVIRRGKIAQMKKDKANEKINS